MPRLAILHTTETFKSAGSAFQFSAHVRWAILNKRAVILCLRTGKYLGLNEVGTQIWKGLSEGIHRSELCVQIGQLYNVDVTFIYTDYDVLISQLLSRRLIEPIGIRTNVRFTPGTFVRFPIPLAFRAWVCHMSVSLRLRFGDFSNTYDFARGCVSRMPDTPIAQLERCLSRFIYAEKFSPQAISQQDCLPRSLSLFIFLVECGFAVRHIIGIADDPLRAHGWVELENTILLDSKDIVQEYLPISFLN